MEFLEDNIETWLLQELEGFPHTDCFLFDCPGQLELYSQVSVFRTLIESLQNYGWQVSVVYTLESTFLADLGKFLSGLMQVLSALVYFEVPHTTVLTKFDISPYTKNIEEFLHPEGDVLEHKLDAADGTKYRVMNRLICGLLRQFCLIKFIPLDITREDSISTLLMHLDISSQFESLT